MQSRMSRRMQAPAAGCPAVRRGGSKGQPCWAEHGMLRCAMGLGSWGAAQINLPDFKLAADSALSWACVVVGHTQAVMVGEIKAECRFNGEAVFSCDLPCTGESAPVRILHSPTHASRREMALIPCTRLLTPGTTTPCTEDAAPSENIMRLKAQTMEFMTGFLKSHNMATDEGAAAGGGHLPACCSPAPRTCGTLQCT